MVLITLTSINNEHQLLTKSSKMIQRLCVLFLMICSFFIFNASLQASEKKAPTNNPTLSAKTDAGKFDELKLVDASIWRCENNIIVKTAESSKGYLMLWKNKLYIMNKIDSLRGVQRYTNDTYHLNWIEIPDKAMLFNFKLGQRVLDYCKTPELASQGTSINQEDLLK
jgi:hypothetical protein